MAFVELITLRGKHVTLEPLAVEHLAALQAAVTDGELWKLWYTTVPTVEGMAADIESRIAKRAAGTMLPFVARRASDNQIVGATTYMNIEGEHRRVEIGSTWYAKSAQRSPINTEAKLLLLTHAFETLDCICVQFMTHWMNHQSRAAIERLGAKLDGVLRAHRIGRMGEQRDTCVYSIIASEWPTVRAHLQHKLIR